MEYTMLRALEESPVREFRHGLAAVRCPRIYYFQDNTRVLQYLPHEGMLHDWLLDLNEVPGDGKVAQAIGAALGIWLSQFHAWSKLQSVSQKQFADVVQHNTESAGSDLNAFFYDFIGKQCKDKTIMEYVSRIMYPTADLKNCVIHGDFSTRK